MLRLISLSLLFFCVVLYATPMESLSEYNLVLVHGAGSHWGGLDCENTTYSEAAKTKNRIGGIGEDGSSATGMIKELKPWIQDTLFNGDYENLVYLQRPFTNPANSPSNNGNEIGKRTWKGRNKCSARRSLFEEIQEVYAKGQDKLEALRNDNVDSYRKIPSRYILVSHSMGGVASREYVQGMGYNFDVDKVVTLDSPHEGTGALNLLLYLKDVDYEQLVKNWVTETIAMEGFAVAAYLMGLDALSADLALLGIFMPTWSAVAQPLVGKGILGILGNGFDYSKSDSLTAYIDPYSGNADNVVNLKSRGFFEGQPSFRMLYGVDGLTFTDPGRSKGSDFQLVVPKSISVPISNALTHLLNGGSDKERVYNTLASMSYGFLAGITLEEHGTALIPSWSGKGTNTTIFNDSRSDVRKESYNGNVMLNSSFSDFQDYEGLDWLLYNTEELFSLGSYIENAYIILLAAGVTSMALEASLFWNQPALKAAKAAAFGTYATILGASGLGMVTIAGFGDLNFSHRLPVLSHFQKKWRADSNSFAKASGEIASYGPYLMEDFLYEKPFVNMGLYVSADSLKKVNSACYYESEKTSRELLCEVGLYGNLPVLTARDTLVTQMGEDGLIDTLYNGVNGNGDSVYNDTSYVYGSFLQQNFAGFRVPPLKFKSESDWSKMGVKVDRWEKVDGLHPDGSINEKGVPIRHVERYEAPAITVDNWIEKYSFVVDDLMPHRLRQIRMNFNYQGEIAWECDIKKDSDANDACTVYKRTSGSEWTELRKEKHPVKKNGQFDFEPRKYGYDNLLAIQKDNQNTVTISTVNKIGLSNTQRFYYLFKATDDLLVPIWPKRDVVVNEISGFEAYASVLDYQGFSVEGMRDSVWYVEGDVRKSYGDLQDMDFLRSEGSGNVYRSRISHRDLSEGEYHWVFNAITHNSAGESNDSNDVYDVPFNVDVTPPNFELSVDKPCMNPDSSVFIARFAWGDSTIPDIRAMRWQLEKSNGNGFSLITSMPSLYDVTSKDFAVAWDKVTNRENLQDGLYRVKATAIDYAAPNLNAYDYASELVSKIAGGNDGDTDWSRLDDYRFNVAEKSVEFRVDRTAPELVFGSVGGTPLDSFGAEKYANLSRPARNSDYEYVSEDSLLQIGYTVNELLGGRDSTAVTIGWDFAHVDDVSKVDRAGDSVWVRDASNVGYGTWTEMSGMRLQDGDYILRANVRDEAKNTKAYDYTKKIRIDRTAPKIVSLVSSRLVYPDSVKDFAATLNVSESDDIATNRTGMRCHYHVLGGDADGLWRNVSEGILKTDTVRFDIPAVAVGERNGKRYLEAVCLDAAGNSSVRTDLFHVGDRYPEIVSPAEDKEFLTAEYIPIVGIAPPASASAENTTVYRLRYRYENSDEWLTENIAVLSSNRSEDSSYISKTAQSTEGVLGYLHNVGFTESKIYIELSTRSCADCEWRSDSALVTVDEVNSAGDVPKVTFELSSTLVEVGKDSLSMSLWLGGNFKDGYLLRIYAEDSKGRGLFDKSTDRVFANPFYGEPADTTLQKGVWFYEKEGLYHLQWNGLAVSDSLDIFFDSGAFGETCLASDGVRNLDNGCKVVEKVSDFTSMQSSAGAYLSDYPIWQFPTYTDRVMTLSGTGGHVAMRSSGMFRIAGRSTLGNSDVPVYFGSGNQSGFVFMGSELSSAVDPWTMGWTVNPKSYGLNYTWNGITSSKSYPPAGKVTLHAEVVQNVRDNPYATLIDTVVTLILPEMEISLDALPEFYIIDNSTDSAIADTGEVRLYDLGSMNIPYGILYRDAYVSARIVDMEGNTVRTLLDSVYTRANTNKSAYSVLWDAKDMDGFAVEPGKYRIVIDASETDENRKKTKSSDITVSLKKMVPASGDGVKLVVSEAFDDNGKNRYVPVPDYLVRADIAAKYLPTDLRNGVTLNASVSGTQRIYGYAPKRFSLAIKRHRKQLDLVVIRKLHTNIEYVDCGWAWGTFGCSEEGQKTQDKIYTDVLSFTSVSRSKTLNVNKLAKDDDGDYGYNDDSYDENYFDIVVFTMSGWEKFKKEKSISGITSVGEFDDALSSSYKIWSLSKVMSNSQKFMIPLPKSSQKNFTFPSSRLDEHCSVEIEQFYLKNFCSYGDSETTAKYDPNANLFNVKMTGMGEDGFYAEKVQINSYSDRERYHYIRFNVELTIPNSYWDAPFGMDNLVNRTVRFDHTNKTIYAESASSTDGYWAALQSNSNVQSFIDEGSYFDGTSWKFDRTYGSLTPYEMQALPFLPASELPDGTNTFLFADEDGTHQQPSYFDLKFYGPRSDSDYFKAIVLGNPLESTTGCDYGNATNYDAAYQLAIDGYVHNPRCQASITSKNGEPDSIRTPLYDAGYVYFYVGRNLKWSDGSQKAIAFPAPTNVLDTISEKCTNNEEWSKVKETASCKKYYKGGSKIHYYLNDFDDNTWTSIYTSDGIIKNPVNSPAHFHTPNDIAYLDQSRMGKSTAVSNLLIRPNASNYKDNSFFVSLDTLAKLKGEKNGYSVETMDARLSASDAKKARFSTAFDTLYFDARDTIIKNKFYRESLDSVSRIPTQMKPVNLPLNYFYRGFHSWIKNPKVDDIDILHLDSTEHSHFAISNEKTSDNRMIKFKDAKDIEVARPKELVELKAYLTSGQKYQLSYLKGGTYYVIKDTVASVSGSHRLAWFDVNRLQGNTQFLLTWGGESDKLYYTNYNLYVGSDVNPDNENIVQSLFGELTVTFPTKSLQKSEDVTVRTAEVDDYPFEEFNNMPLTGPVMEVLPSMEFNDTTKLPRIQMRISKAEMDSKGVTPQTLTLYKIDFENKKFVPLTNALYGYLKADGSAAVSTGSSEKATCSAWNSGECFPGDDKWEYILISAETKTFSVFAAMSSALANSPDFNLEILPEVATSTERIVKVKGISNYALYVDNDSLWNDKGDQTPAVLLDYTTDSNGFAHISLPSRTDSIDTTYIFAVALGDQDASGNSVELPAAPAVARAITVPSEFACSVPSDSLWLGLDNGYMAYGASCNHPGVGTVSLYREGKVVAEVHGNIPDTLIYDGSRVYGASVVGKIANGVYESRYLGVSSLGTERQLAGPLVYTDSIRPSVEGFDVQESFEILDRVFTVTAKVRDSESGVAAVTVSPEFGGTSLEKTTLQPDSLGNVSLNLRMSRKSIAGCIGCRLKLSFRAEDYGHNHADTTFITERLYPYPGELALWYPAREGAGRTAHEFLGTGHDLNLSPIRSPWQSDAGIYLSSASDRAAGAGRVDLGTADSYTLETRIKRGHSPDTWNDILSFAGPGGLSIKLSQKGRSLKLSEAGREWFSGEVLSASTKTWEHVAVVSDSSGVRFYVDGERVKSVPDGIAAERELYGTLTLGGTSGNSFVGNIADVRFYSDALTDAEIATLSVPATNDGDPSSVIVVAVKDMDVLDGFSGQFSCAVAGNRYLLAGSAHSRLRVTVNVETAGNYRIVAYARSANLSSADVSIGEGSLLSGQISLSDVWRTTEISGVSLSLSRGIHTLSLDVPEGVQLGGIALTRGSVSPSMIAWGRSSFDMVPATVNPPKILTSLKFEGFGDLSMLRPRIRLKNVSDETVNGYSVRYYFRGEDPSQVQVAAFYPYATSGLAVHSESARTGYAEWNFAGESLAPRDSAFYGEGPHFGLYNADWSPWNVGDDPSYVAAAEHGFAEDAGIVVLDRDNNLIGGRCAEMEDETSVVTKARILASDMRSDNQASEIHFKVENLGNVALRNFDIRYYFYVEEGLAPIMDINHLASCSTAELTSLGGGRWQVNVHCGGAIGAGNSMENPVNISLHLSGWANIWNASDDPGHAGLSGDMSEARGICVFDSLGNRIYGESPQWPESSVIAEELPNGGSGTNPDNGYHGDVAIPIARTEDGFILTLDAWTSLSMDLVNAVGVPIKSIFNGTLAPGEQLVQVDWTGINMWTTYLVLKVNGTIKTTRLLSLM